jgi:hypothetical protein
LVDHQDKYQWVWSKSKALWFSTIEFLDLTMFNMCTVISAAYGKQVSQFSQTCVLCFSSVSAKQNLFLCCSQPLWCLSMVKDYLVRRNCHMLDHFLFPLICFGLWLPTSLVGCRFFLSSSQTSFICLTNNQQHSTPFTFEFNKCMHFF